MFTTFWQNLTSSIYNPHFYARVLRGAHGEHTGTRSFVVIFSLIAAGIMVSGLYTTAVHMRDMAKRVPAIARDAYPDTMVLTLLNGELSVQGVDEPVYIGRMQDWAQADAHNRTWPSYFAVVDTKTPYSEDAHRAADAFIWVGKTAAIPLPSGDVDETADVTVDDGMLTYTDLEGLARNEPHVVTKTDIDGAAQRVAGVTGYIVPSVLVVGFVVGWVLYMLGMLMFAVAGGVLVRLLSWVAPHLFAHVAPRGVTFMAAMRASVFAGVLPNIVMLVGWLTPVTLSYSMYLLSVAVIVFLNVRGYVEEKK